MVTDERSDEILDGAKEAGRPALPSSAFPHARTGHQGAGVAGGRGRAEKIGPAGRFCFSFPSGLVVVFISVRHIG